MDVEKTENSNAGALSGKSLYMYKIGDNVKLTATFHTYNWVDGKEVGNVTAVGDVTCVDITKEQIGHIEGWSVQNNAPTNFKTPKTQIFKNDGSAKLYVLLKGKNANGDDMFTANFSNYPNSTQGAAEWKYTSSNTSVLQVTQTGTEPQVYGVSEGMATVVISYDGVQVGSCDITVVGPKKLAMATLSTDRLVLTNKFSDPTAISFEGKDQLGQDMQGLTAEVVANGSYSPSPYVSGTTFNGNAGTKVPAGTYGFTVKVKDGNDNTISLNFTVVVQDPGDNATTQYYRIESNKISYDVKSGDTLSNVKAELKVYGYTSSGVKNERYVGDLTALEQAGYVITVKNPDGATVTGSAIDGSSIIGAAGVNGNEMDLSGRKSVSGGARYVAVTEKTGTWLITATKAGATSVNPLSFEVKNTQAKVEVTRNKNFTDKNNVVDAINDCLSFVVGDKTLTADAAWVGNDYVVVGNNITLKKLKLYEHVTGTDYIEHEVDMSNYVITMK